MSNDQPFTELWYRNRHGQVVAAPCLSLVIYLDETDAEQILSFFEAAREALAPRLTHYLAERMNQPAKITPRSLSMVPTWLQKPKEGHQYFIAFWGGELMDVSPWSITVSLNYIAPDPARRERAPRFLAEWEKKRASGQAELPCTTLRVTVPVDAPLAMPEAWIRWVMGLKAIQDGEFMLAESSLSLSVREDYDGQGFAYAACARYPGLDWFELLQGRFLRRYEPSLDAVLPQVKRAAWLTFLNEVAVKALGGAETLAAALTGEPGIVLHPVRHGVGIQAGPQPELGDLSLHEISLLQRRVARVVRPVRINNIPLAYREDFVAHWLNMFDAENHNWSPP